MSKHIYTLRTKVGEWEVAISPSTRYGYFEWQHGGESQTEGGLWFNANQTLIDWDGVSFLPRFVVAAIQQLGWKVSQEDIDLAR